MNLFKKFLAVIALATATINTISAQITAFRFTSLHPDWIGYGQTRTLESDGWNITATVLDSFTTLPTPLLYSFNVTASSKAPGSTDHWLIGFGQSLVSGGFELGKTYSGAYIDPAWTSNRYAPGTTATMIFAGDYIYPTDVAGWFRVFDFVTGASGEVVSLAVDLFQQNQTPGYLGDWNFVSARINSTVQVTTNFSYTPVPEPATYGKIAGVIILGITVWWKRRNTVTT